MKKINHLITGRMKRTLAFMSLVTIMLLMANVHLRSWGPNKSVITLETSYAFLGLGATLKAKKITVKGKDDKDEEKTAYENLDPATKSFVDSIDEVLKGISEGKLDKKALETELGKFEEKHGKGLNDEQMKSFNELVESVKKQGEELAKLKDGGVPTVEKEQSFHGKITAALMQHKSDLEKLEKSQHGFKINLKAADSLLTTSYVTSAPNSYLPMPTVMPGVRETPEETLNVMQLINMTTSDSPSVTWVNELPVEGDADYTSEGELKSQVAWKYNNETATSSKITAFIKVTTQALRNIKFLANRINTRLRYLILNKVEDGLINGDGADGALTGIVSYAPGFTTTAFNDSVEDPQTVDALVCMAGQIDQMLYTPTTAMLNPVDIRKMKLVKDKNGNYVMPPFTTTNGTYVDNMRVVPNRKIAIGYALVGDFMKANGFIVEDVMLDIGLDADDFTKNRRTILAEIELGHFMSAIEVGAFCYESLATVKAAIAAVGDPE